MTNVGTVVDEAAKVGGTCTGAGTVYEKNRTTLDPVDDNTRRNQGDDCGCDHECSHKLGYHDANVKVFVEDVYEGDEFDDAMDVDVDDAIALFTRQS